jgi:hypothetical protein
VQDSRSSQLLEPAAAASSLAQLICESHSVHVNNYTKNHELCGEKQSHNILKRERWIYAIFTPFKKRKIHLEVSNIIDTDFKPSEIATYPNLIHSLEGF